MARHFTRWDPVAKLIGLRFSNVMDVEDYAAFPSFADDPRAASGTCGATSTRATAPWRCGSRWRATSPGSRRSSSRPRDTVAGATVRRAVAEYFPDVPVRRPIEGRETLLSIDKARRLLGYDPQHTWRDEV